ncbi:hypothetical protein E2L08_16165 [Palleronia sediminis]|uniref:Flagellar protein FlgN n=1 Tax=Palleronia sediminis TaxID=2547833 RepID=A0A4R5ZWC7_9RHOB|nr:hypothetical protein [Palleronia sediminis]TDL74207.1 hypothetical protein E2L08_16165 [Palleronia sediminis]
MNRRRLAELDRVAGALLDRDLAALRTVARHVAALERDAAQLRAARDARARDTVLDPARLAGADLAWGAWCDRRLARLQAQIAALRVDHELALNKARTAFGRHEATGALVARGARTPRGGNGPR